MKKKFLYCQLRTAHCFLPTVYRLLLTAYCLLPTFSFSQHNNFQTYSIEQGLPNATIYSILQDKRGYLWIGTDGGGLCHFDGLNFKAFGKKERFKGQEIRSLLQDKKGRIWAGTKGEGIIIYDGLKFTSIGKKQGLSGSAILCLMEDENGTIWAGTDDGGLNKITHTKDSLKIEVIDESKGLSSNSIFNIYKDKKDRIWLATFGGVNIISFLNNSLLVDQFRGGKEIPSDYILSIKEDKNGVLWFGTLDDGIFCIDPRNADLHSSKVTVFNRKNGFNATKIWNIFKTSDGELWFASWENGIVRQHISSNIKDTSSSNFNFEDFSTKDGLPSKQVLCLFEDNEKNMWIGTGGGGLCKFMGDAFSHYSEKDGLQGNMVMGIDQDTVGNLWLATIEGLVQFNLKNNVATTKTFTIKDGLSNNSLMAISIGKTAHNKNIWTAVLDGGISRYKGKSFENFSGKQGLPDGDVYSILVDKNGIVWCGTQEGISRFDGEKFMNMSLEAMMIKDKGVFSIIQDKNENIWFGTKGGLASYSGGGTVTTYDEVEGLNYDEAAGLSHKAVNSLAEAKNGNIWLGTSNGGLYMFDANTKDKIKISFIAGDSLLGSNAVNSLIFQSENILLVGTDKGFSKITLDKNGKINSVRNYDASDGFIGVECNDNAIYKDKENNIWFGTIKGLTRFNPSAEIENNNPPRIHITDIKLFFKEIDWSKRTDSILPWFNIPRSLALPYSDNHLTFDFTAISLANSRHIKYRYMLEGADSEWSPDRKETSVTFSGLAPGTYTFKVVAAGANGVWNKEPATFKFTISPPWYRTMLFYIICLIVVVGGIYFFIKYRERALVLEKKILEDKVTERTVEVVKQKEHIEEQKKEITDSINYAKRIQQSILPPLEEVEAVFPNSFILFKPKDIVSGDFYWFHLSPSGGGSSAAGGTGEVSPFEGGVRQGRTGDVVFIAAADCTGHGVPGAFMSTIGSEKLNEAVAQSNDVGTILQSVNMLMKKVLRQSNKDDSTRDGMDIALCAFNREMTSFEYAGANRPLWIIRKGSTVIEETKATKTAIGGLTDDKQEFAKHKVEVQKGDSIYLFSDGYADQFGSNNKKLMTRKFKEILLSIQDKTMDEQNIFLDTTIEDWKGGMEQTDDILVIGIKI